MKSAHHPSRPLGSNHGVGYCFEGLQFWVDLTAGGRITWFGLDEQNLLIDRDAEPELFGSTLWTAPQKDWGWPPVPALDSEAYTPDIGRDEFTLTSAASGFGVRFRKTFKPLIERRGIDIEYAIENTSGETLSCAPWEVTRVRGAQSFFPGTSERSFHIPEMPALDLTDAEGVCWFDFDAGEIRRDQKSFCHASEGWLAHVQDGMLFVKSFPFVAQAGAAPGEALVEIFARGDHAYIELENVGEYRALAPGERYLWPVRWLIRRLPAELDPRRDRASLLQLARAMLA